MYLKAFLGLFVIAVYTAGACTVMSLLKAYGMGGVYPVYMGSALLLLGILAVLIVVLARSYARPFRCIDRQLDALLQNEDSPIQLPEGLASTDQKLNALKQAMEKRLFSAQMAEQQKNELVMYLAHDIRTPLTSVIGYLSLLDEARDMPEEQREKYTHITLEKANKLEKMINEFF